MGEITPLLPAESGSSVQTVMSGAVAGVEAQEAFEDPVSGRLSLERDWESHRAASARVCMLEQIFRAGDSGIVIAAAFRPPMTIMPPQVMRS